MEVFGLSTRAFAHIGCGDYREAWDVLRLGRTLARERDNHFIYGRLTNTLTSEARAYLATLVSDSWITR